MLESATVSKWAWGVGVGVGGGMEGWGNQRVRMYDSTGRDAKHLLRWCPNRQGAHFQPSNEVRP